MREDNAKKTKELADKEFPGENWKKLDEGIYLSPHRPIGKNTNFAEENQDAQILKSFGNTIYFVPENRAAAGKKYDAIVNGEKMEFKNIHGGLETLKEQFLRSRSQAPNVFINLEKSSLVKHDIIAALFGARNSPRYAQKNLFSGGKIILKIKGKKNLVYLNVDNLEITEKNRARSVRWGAGGDYYPNLANKN
jgi:hypothetical protein